MDFSGRTGRVIDNPVEAQSAALEEGQTWRVSRFMKADLFEFCLEVSVLDLLVASPLVFLLALLRISLTQTGLFVLTAISIALPQYFLHFI